MRVLSLTRAIGHFTHASTCSFVRDNLRLYCHKSIVDYIHHAPYLDVLHTTRKEPFSDIHKRQVCHVRSSRGTSMRLQASSWEMLRLRSGVGGID